MQKLRQAGIACRETEFTDSNGDILIENSDDVIKVQKIIQDLQQKANP